MRKKFSTLILIIGILLIVISAVQLYRISNDYHESNELYEKVEKEFVTIHADLDEAIQWYELASVDFEQLKEMNEDVVGWIYFENEEISYPILYSGDNETYLRTAMDKTPATAGSIFLEGANNPSFEECHTLIYGHNMRNLSMFGKLKYYKKDNYYEDHSYFQIILDGKVHRYQIFAYSDVPADSFVYAVPFGPDETFQTFLDNIMKQAYHDTGITATKDDKIITLSTCSAGDNRFVVHALRVDTYEYK